jgi:hypothetical protein
MSGLSVWLEEERPLEERPDQLLERPSRAGLVLCEEEAAEGLLGAREIDLPEDVRVVVGRYLADAAAGLRPPLHLAVRQVPVLLRPLAHERFEDEVGRIVGDAA